MLLIDFTLCTFREVDILMPGYTHLQRAQPIRWSHWMLRYHNTNNMCNVSLNVVLFSEVLALNNDNHKHEMS